MSNLTATEVRGMMEAYNAVYAPQQEEQEVQELALEIIENAAYVLFSQGYDVEDVISYFTEATEEVITEDFVNFAEGNVILESVAVSDEYIAEQFEVLNEILGRLAQGAIKLGSKVFGAGAGAMKGGAGAKGALGAMAKSATRSASQTLGKATTAAKGLMSKAGGALGKVGGALSKVPGAKAAGKVIGRAAPGVGAALYGMDAVSRAKKGDWGGAALSGLGAGLSLAPGVGTLASLAPAGVQMATDALGLTGDKSRKAPAAKTTPSGAPKPPKGAGMVNVPGKGQRYYASSDKKYYKNYNDALAARNSRRGVKPPVPPAPASSAPPAPSSPARSSTATATTRTSPSTPSKPPTGKLGGTTFERRTPTSVEFKGAQEYRQQNPNAKPEDVLKAAQEAGKRQTSVDTDLAKANTPAELNKPAPAGSALAAEQERRRKKEEEEAKKQTVSASYEYDAYDLVLDYLLENGHADTVDEAHYVMLEMDSKMIKSIVEGEEGKKEPQKPFTGEGPKKPKGWKPTGPKLKSGQRPGYAR